MPSVDLLYVDGSGHAGLASGSGTTEPIYPVIPEPTPRLGPLGEEEANDVTSILSITDFFPSIGIVKLCVARKLARASFGKLAMLPEV